MALSVKKSTVSTVYLYSNSTSKILLYPTSPDVEKLPQQFREPILKQCQVKPDGPQGGITLRLSKSVWRSPKSQHGVEARKIALDLIRALYATGHTLHCSADLARRGNSAAGCLIVSNGRPSTSTELSCISLHGRDTIRLISVPEHEAGTFHSALQKACGTGVTRTRIISTVLCPEYKVSHGNPWIAEGKNTVYARWIVLEMLKHMADFGWMACTPVKVTSSDTDLDTLIFQRSKRQQVSSRPVEMVCVSLHRLDTFRLIGIKDGDATVAALRNAITGSWSAGLKTVGKYDVSTEYIVNGHPWLARKSVETIASRRLMCRVLESMQNIGWRVYAALDLSKKLTDKSSFYFIRDEKVTSETIGCISLTDANKVQLTDLPQKTVETIMHLAQSGRFGALTEPPQRYDERTASFKLRGTPWDYHRKSIDIMSVSCLVQRIIQITMDGGGRFLCSADLSARTYTTGTNDHRETHSADLDSFFFAFPK